MKAPIDNANLGINYPADYCQRTGITLITPCYINGNTQITTDRDGNPVPDDKLAAHGPALVSFPYNASGVAGASNFPPANGQPLAKLGPYGGLLTIGGPKRSLAQLSLNGI
ncbi:hypothetical protein [Spirosoma telluris]|uniref:hypothetical protein n=1 Tax=Spirosoma telluris TaxID=2183553 RepID=UPI002FC3C279